MLFVLKKNTENKFELDTQNPERVGEKNIVNIIITENSLMTVRNDGSFTIVRFDSVVTDGVRLTPQSKDVPQLYVNDNAQNTVNGEK